MPSRALRRYLRHGTLPQLAVFESVARLGSFTRAAEELHMAQPTVSVQAKKLAETVGLPLLEQVGKKIHLTGAGRELQAACDDIFRRLEQLDARLAAMRGLEAGTLRLAVTTTAKYFAPRLLGEFCHEHPGLEVALALLNRQSLLQRLADNLDDLYLFSNPPADIEVVTHPIMPNPMVVVARADHPLATKSGLPFAAIAGEPMLVREPGSGTRMVLEDVFEQQGATPRVRMELGSNEAIKQAILGDLGISILSRHALDADYRREGLAILDVKGFPVERQWYAVYPAGRQLSPAAARFVEFLKDAAGREPGATVARPARPVRTTRRRGT